MIGEAYPTRFTYMNSDDMLLFSFISKGRRVIEKVILFNPVVENGIRYYNWGFGDFSINKSINGANVDDKSETNNGDVKRVFYTVVSTLSVFFEYHPTATVRIKGSDTRRMKVYKSLIVRHWNEIKKLYSVRMLDNNMTSDFNKEKDCDYILISQLSFLTSKKIRYAKSHLP